MKIIERILESDQSIPQLLLTIVVLIFAYITLRLVEFFWKQYKQKDERTEQLISELTEAVRENTISIKSLDNHMSEFPKIKTDLNRMYSAVKMMAGDDWPRIRKEIMDDHGMREI